jgi:hypothetical protein
METPRLAVEMPREEEKPWEEERGMVFLAVLAAVVEWQPCQRGCEGVAARGFPLQWEWDEWRVVRVIASEMDWLEVRGIPQRGEPTQITVMSLVSVQWALARRVLLRTLTPVLDEHSRRKSRRSRLAPQ